MSFVQRSIVLCPYLGGSTIGGSTVPLMNSKLMVDLVYKELKYLSSIHVYDIPLFHANSYTKRH